MDQSNLVYQWPVAYGKKQYRKQHCDPPGLVVILQDWFLIVKLIYSAVFVLVSVGGGKDEFQMMFFFFL